MVPFSTVDFLQYAFPPRSYGSSVYHREREHKKLTTKRRGCFSSCMSRAIASSHFVLVLNACRVLLSWFGEKNLQRTDLSVAPINIQTGRPAPEEKIFKCHYKIRSLRYCFSSNNASSLATPRPVPPYDKFCWTRHWGRHCVPHLKH